MNKFRNFFTNPTVYHMHHSDERYENRDKKYSTIIQIDAKIWLLVFEITLEMYRIWENFHNRKVLKFDKLSNGISFVWIQ
jgi:hypothetical protein